MSWSLDDARPIYLQLEDIIKSKIIAGIYKPGQKLPLCSGTGRGSRRQSEHHAESSE